MKAIILAAGMGTRMEEYTETLPKGMLPFNGKPIIEWQIETLRNAGIEDIAIVTGYRNDKIKIEGITYYHNPDYSNTNMLESMMAAKDALNSDTLICYADIIYTQEVLKTLRNNPAPIAVAVDCDWKDYWKLRYDTTECDLESLVVVDNKIIELGKELTSSADIDYRYIWFDQVFKSCLG